MATHNQLIQSALARGVRAGTALQDAIGKVRRARRKNEVEFELALGELFVLSSEAFKERNGLREKFKHAQVKIATLEAELRYLKENS